ncbi:MAG TPA: SLBB domain-containing protein, partial [Ignavibacteriaceae bacterium]|nr:SLBB domain-containing protein [Ignavibacteriaceae bacterium]
IFAPADLTTNFFTISGAVNNPGKFPYVHGDKLSDAIELAQGINKSYENVTLADIFRLSYNGEKMQKIKVNLDSVFYLERGDRILVAADESQKKAYSVLVLGEVNRPGQIPITKSNTTLREVLKEAGGFTKDASLNRAKLIRGTNLQFILEKEFGLNLEKESQYLNQYPNPIVFQYEKAKMLSMSTLTEQDTGFFYIDETIRQMLNESSFDFGNVMDDSSESGNEKLRDGDIIIIPQKVNTVYVYGQVVKPGSMKFAEGKDFSYYIDEAGGLGPLAKSGEIAVIKGSSREWIPAKDNVEIKPGDFIYVPKNPNRSFDYYIGQVAAYLGIIGSLATIYLLLKSL